MPKEIVRKAKAQGGDLIDLDDEIDRIVIEFDFSYHFATDDATVDAATQRLYGSIQDRVLGFQESEKLPEAYLLLFMGTSGITTLLDYARRTLRGE
jgi:hypothetical protein